MFHKKISKDIQALIDNGLVASCHDDNGDTLLSLTTYGMNVNGETYGEYDVLCQDDDVEIENFVKKAEKDLTNEFECCIVCE